MATCLVEAAVKFFVQACQGNEENGGDGIQLQGEGNPSQGWIRQAVLHYSQTTHCLAWRADIEGPVSGFHS